MTHQSAKMFQLLRKLVERCRIWLRAERHREEKRSLLNSLKECFERDFLNASDFYRAKCTDHISAEEYETEKTNFVRAWVTNLLDNSPDPEQAAAIGAVEGHVQVVARAGSGKTTTLVNRALFLQRLCGVKRRTRCYFLPSIATRLRRCEMRLASISARFHSPRYDLPRPGLCPDSS